MIQSAPYEQSRDLGAGLLNLFFVAAIRLSDLNNILTTISLLLTIAFLVWRWKRAAKRK